MNQIATQTQRTLDSSPSIDVYTTCWNEERMLPYFLRHYGQFARRIVVYDNYSTDRSVEIAKSHPITKVRAFGSSKHQCGEAERMALRQHVWQESRGAADWVIVVDCDEFLWHLDLIAYLDQCHHDNVTIPRPTGYEMISPRFPSTQDQIYDEVRTGLRAEHMDKWVVFNPNAVRAMNYSVGCHGAKPEGTITFDGPSQLRLLHYRHLGLPYVLERYQQLRARRTDEDRQRRWNVHYTWDETEISNWFAFARQTAVDVLL